MYIVLHNIAMHVKKLIGNGTYNFQFLCDTTDDPWGSIAGSWGKML